MGTAKKKIPDPDGKNVERAAWALHAVRAFQEVTGSDDETALGDLLCDLMHLAEQMPKQFQTFERALTNARFHHAAETSNEGEP